MWQCHATIIGFISHMVIYGPSCLKINSHLINFDLLCMNGCIFCSPSCLHKWLLPFYFHISLLLWFHYRYSIIFLEHFPSKVNISHYSPRFEVQRNNVEEPSISSRDQLERVLIGRQCSVMEYVCQTIRRSHPHISSWLSSSVPFFIVLRWHWFGWHVDW